MLGRIQYKGDVITLFNRSCPVPLNNSNEAANIIWENLTIQGTQLRLRILLVTLVIFGVYCLLLLLFVVMKQSSTKSLREFPPTLDCDSMRKAFN